MLRAPQHTTRRCPRCDATRTIVQGIDACPDCDWLDVDGVP
ncbi:hypothetical protein [Natrialbaceae archaeon AArc-T1-2]|nr:hypothetical protein [Natrialbaceae archaeon AArc-T1-2]WIV68139.1 hypothetical protein QQ977_05265 [Natrialbaceae archaeon AArc-T1-2]